ncbi:MAG TPA: pyridoxamine 5'-phosphate oxidase family protein, partial [Salinimicrobium sp.]|nr:pyridoxamine 5'-phosphate oxidase family protein [Salinimicrobium sp.]
KNISKDNEIQLVFSDPSEMEFISIYGKATVTTDPQILKEMYNSKTDIWFEGPDDPNLTAIKVRALDAYYWDSKSNKYVTLLKMGISAATGKNMDIGEKGRLDV